MDADDPLEPRTDGPGEPPTSLLVLGTIDALEYEALLDFEAATDREAVSVLRELEADLSRLDRSRLEALDDLVATRLDPEAYRPDGE